MSQCPLYYAESDGMRCMLAEGHPGLHQDADGMEWTDDESE